MAERTVFQCNPNSMPGDSEQLIVDMEITQEDEEKDRCVIKVIHSFYGKGLKYEFTAEMAEALGQALLDAAKQLRKEQPSP